MKIQYLGHACFRLISNLGNSVICDPFDEKLVGYAMAEVKADVVTISHSHADHSFVDAVLGDPAIIDCKTTCCADDICIESFDSFHDDQKGAKRGKNLVFRFLIDGISVAHLGDLGEMTAELTKQLKNVDVLLIPVGGTYTIDATQAKNIVDSVEPKIVIPMHYADEGNLDISPVSDFLNIVDEAFKIEYLNHETLTLEDKPEEDCKKVIVLKRMKD